MNRGSYYERKLPNSKLKEIGNMIKNKRISLGKECKTREGFLNYTASFLEIDWISTRYLSSIEEGKNMISIQMLIDLAYALQMNPEDLFKEILNILKNDNTIHNN